MWLYNDSFGSIFISITDGNRADAASMLAEKFEITIHYCPLKIDWETVVN